MTLLVQRHKTAIKRPDISRPVRLALDQGILNLQATFFDYGCGHGDDISRLRERGIVSSGWDPIHRPHDVRQQADVVNLGYVVNVIEDRNERVSVLKDAWSLARKLLIVSARLSIEGKNNVWSSTYADGCFTNRGTFQKFYEQHELRDWINDVLGVQSVAVAPGIFYVFQDNELLQSFGASRCRRTTPIPRQKYSHRIFEENRELFDPLIEFITSRGRLPHECESEIAAGIREKVGSLQRAFAIIRQVTGADRWNQIREERSQDLLVYLALTRFRGRPRFSHLPFDLQLDVRAFFSTYREASKLADNLLFSAGKPEFIAEACNQSPVGKKTPEALYLHTTALPFLAPVLRIYEGCARAYIGAVDGANIIKLNRNKPQVSYLHYPNFEKDPHPALAGSLVVPLRSFHVTYQDYSDSQNPFILHRKETFVALDHPLRDRFARLTSQEERVGLYETPRLIGTLDGWKTVLGQKGVHIVGHRILRDKKPRAAAE
ncbi:MAG: DNA phosphorothioation-associated putative methyltransferase [Pyrinomonadaceae bacterium]